MKSQTALQFVVACAGGGVLQRWAFDPQAQALELVQEIDCSAAAGSLAWRAEKSILSVSLRSAPHKVLQLYAREDLRLEVIGEVALPADMAYIGLDGSREGLLCASYHDAQIAWVRAGQVESLSTQGAAHACMALGGGRLIIATETKAGTVLCLRGTQADTPLPLRELLRLRWHEAASPRHIASAGEYVFINNEEQNLIDVCRYAPHDNTLNWLFAAEVPFLGAGQPWYADIRSSEDGRRLWVSERRQGVVHCLEFDMHEQRLNLLSTMRAPATPRGIAEYGGYIVTCGESAASFSVCHCERDGQWRELASAACPQRPMWVEFLSPGKRQA